MSGILLHPIPRRGDPTDFQLRFASKEITQRLFNKFISAEQRSARTFLAVVKTEPELAAFAGFVLEDNMHDRIPQGLKVMAKELRARADSTTSQEVTLPKLTLVGCPSHTKQKESS